MVILYVFFTTWRDRNLDSYKSVLAINNICEGTRNAQSSESYISQNFNRWEVISVIAPTFDQAWKIVDKLAKRGSWNSDFKERLGDYYE